MHPSKLLRHRTVKEVADLLQVTERSVRGYIASGELEAIKVRIWRISEEHLGKFPERRSAHKRDRIEQILYAIVHENDVSVLPSDWAIVVQEYHSCKFQNLGQMCSEIQAASNNQEIPCNVAVRTTFCRVILAGDFASTSRMLRIADKYVRDRP